MADQKPKPSESAEAAVIPLPTAPEPSQKVGEQWAPEVVTEAEAPLFIKMLIYGQSGIGKTRLAASVEDSPILTPVLFVDAEAGAMSIRDRLNANSTSFHRFRMDSYAKLQSFNQYMRTKVHEQYKTVIIDSLSDLGKTVIRQCVIDARRANSSHDPEIPDQRDWGRYTERMRIIIRTLKDAQVNVILTALVRDQKDELTGKVSYSPALQGQAASTDAMAYMDIVGYYAPVGGGKSTPTLFFGTNAQYVAKDRSGALPEKIEEPTFPQLYQLIMGGKK